MSEKRAEPAAALPASTVLLLRDGDEGLEVFMVKRHYQIDFAGGALVFPGGKVDPADAELDPRHLDPGSQALQADGLAFRVAAIREAFEETGVLLAEDLHSGELPSGERASALASRYAADLEQGRTDIASVCRRESLRLRCAELVHFAHWITPLGRPKRFDTHFFLAAAPPAHIAAHDGRESVDSVWITPARALQAAEQEQLSIVFPTRMNLKKLGESDSVAAALEAARASRVVTVLPESVALEDGSRLMRIPAEAGYGFSEIRYTGPSASR